MNSEFVNLVIEPAKYWNPVSQWDNPIWGWVVFNYANNGLQFFLQNRSFYREIRFSGPNGSLESSRWLPQKPCNDDMRNARQLQKLLDILRDEPKCLKVFIEMVNGAMDSMLSNYTEFMSSLIARPLALVNMAWLLNWQLRHWKTMHRSTAKAYRRD
jgi:hypothetical protein